MSMIMRATCSGSIARLGDRADLRTDAVKVDGRRIHAAKEHCYLLLNKPRGYLCTTSDPEGRSTVMELVPKKLHRGLHPVGRLDYNTEGLLLLTSDGAFSQRVAHPSHGCTKVYEVKVKGRPDETTLRRLREGVVLGGRRTAPCRIVPRSMGRSNEGSNSWWTVTLSEGRTRQIREMFFRVGHTVQRLRRSAVGPVHDPKLPLGSYRELRQSEVRGLLEGRTIRSKKRTTARRPKVKRRS